MKPATPCQCQRHRQRVATPASPIQNDCANTSAKMRQRGMPKARKTAYSRRDAAVGRVQGLAGDDQTDEQGQYRRQTQGDADPRLRQPVQPRMEREIVVAR